MYRLTIDPAELHVFIHGEFKHTIQLADYPELETARQQIIAIVEQHRSPEQIRNDALVELAIQTNPEAVAEIIELWRSGVYYRTGKYLHWGGQIYRVVQGHPSQAQYPPGQTEALYTLANKTSTDPVTAISDWIQPTGAHDAYGEGDRVRFDGIVYESAINNNTWSPVAYPDGWKEITNGIIE